MEKTICGKKSIYNLLLILRAELYIFQDRESYKFNTLRKVMLSILDSRRELLGATLTQDQTLELQMMVVSKIDWGNR